LFFNLAPQYIKIKPGRKSGCRVKEREAFCGAPVPFSPLFNREKRERRQSRQLAISN
jgi:hypothetical protein